MTSRVMYCPFNPLPKETSMAQTRTGPHPFATPETPSFRDLLDRVAADESLDTRRKADLCSAIRAAGHWLGIDLTANTTI